MDHLRGRGQSQRPAAEAAERASGEPGRPRGGLTGHRAGPPERGAERLTLTVEEAAAVLGISRTLAYELVALGDLPCLHLGRRIVISRQVIERMLGAESPA